MSLPLSQHIPAASRTTAIPQRWTTAWVTQPLAAAVAAGRMEAAQATALETSLCRSVRAYEAWLAHQGLTGLLAFAARVSRRNTDSAHEAVSSTWLDVRQRLETAVERSIEGRSVPDFSDPRAVAKYHEVQVRLRLQGRWSRQRTHAELKEGMASRPATTVAVVATRRQARALQVAALWSLQTLGLQDTHARWWATLRHCVELDEVTFEPSRRNDPTEARLSLQGRFLVCSGMRRKLDAWADGRAAWSPCSVHLAEAPPTADRMAEAADAVATLRPALERALEALECTKDERDTLRKCIVEGRLLRTRLRHMTGGTGEARRARFWSLCEAWGRLAA